MKHLRPGSKVRARVLGFLPGRKVVLDVEGDSVVAWSDLPLVRGRTVLAVVEAGENGPRLRVHEGGEGPPAAGEEAAAATLEELVRATAAEFDVAVAPATMRGLIRELREAVPDLDREVIPLLSLREEIGALLAARARRIPASRRALQAIRLARGGRLGRALARLIDELDDLERFLRGGSSRGAGAEAERFRSYFVDLGAPEQGTALLDGLRRVGYGHEAALAAAGREGWDESDDGEEPSDLKGDLIALDRWLRDLPARDLPRRGAPARRAARRALAWCGHLLDVIESIQVQNLPTDRGTPGETWQVPVRIDDETGTLFLLFRATESRFWLDIGDREAIAVRLAPGGAPEIFVGAEEEAVAPGTARLDRVL